MAPAARSYDYIVIGGGSGGSGAARRAAGWYGAKTLLVENGRSVRSGEGMSNRLMNL
ncbi:hypothetical protein CC78DRAFT_530282 [Lojkania enalia]|uniref:FAD/NAD(P)-binding domain-containing protein n=1 Tax=Lojkania enalia TaxID=147567 RepID=A0A9P4N877_9PLEO|nr:hypothetical protein CC78DRAFT_530282 [Didymosphaeria enalia]